MVVERTVVMIMIAIAEISCDNANMSSFKYIACRRVCFRIYYMTYGFQSNDEQGWVIQALRYKY